MDKKTVKAIRGSIKKWEDIEKGTGMDFGVGNCPLCHLFKWAKKTQWSLAVAMN